MVYNQSRSLRERKKDRRPDSHPCWQAGTWWAGGRRAGGHAGVRADGQTDEGTLTEGDSSVQLTSLLRSSFKKVR